MAKLDATLVDGAALEAHRDTETGRVYLKYQPRLDGDLLWDVTYRESYGFTSGWTDEAFFGSSKEEAFNQAPQHGRPYRDEHVTARVDQEPIGWTLDQIARARVWAQRFVVQLASAAE